MTGLLRRIAEYIGDLFNRFSPERRVMMVLLFLVVIGVSAALLYWAFKPQYKLLYTDLSLEDSAQIIEVLGEEKIPYRIESDGRRILVPASKVYDTRLKLAVEELPMEEGTGWEIFDKPSLGVTDFVQRLNFRRGLEGELARTILQLEPVEAVRVHLVIPEESLFRETQKEPMASVTLRLRRSKKLALAQVEGITYMVASAVEGLSTSNVTVIDKKGYVLSEQREADPIMRLTANQLDLQNQVEARLIKKGQDLLDKQFGHGKSAIQVSASLDFQTLEKTQELYDADNPSVRSEEISSSTSLGSDTSSSNTETSVTNYELNLTRELTVKPVGDIKRMTVAVMVDGNYVETTDPESGKTSLQFEPLSTSKLDEISSTIKMALGFNAVRGDDITVVSVPFQEIEMVEKEMVTLDRWQLFYRYGQKIITLIAILLLLLLVRNFLRKAEEAAGIRVVGPRAQLAPGMEEAEKEALPPPIDLGRELSPEARKDAVLQEQVSRYANENPEMAANLIRSWLVD